MASWYVNRIFPAARTRFFKARSLIVSPSKKSIARLALPSRPALKSLSGSGSLAPWAKVTFLPYLCGRWRPRLFRRETTPGFPSTPFLDYLPVCLKDALADAGKRFATPVSEFCDQLVNKFRWIHWIFMPRILVPFHATMPASIYPRQDLLQVCKELVPPALGALVVLLLILPEARLLHAQMGPRARRGESPSDDTLETIGRPRVRERFVRLRCRDLCWNLMARSPVESGYGVRQPGQMACQRVSGLGSASHRLCAL